MISYQGACDGRAQVTLGYRSGGQSDWGQADYIRTKWQEVGLTALSSSPTTNTDLLCQTHIYRLHMHSTRTAYNKNEPRLGSPEIFKKKMFRVTINNFRHLKLEIAFQIIKKILISKLGSTINGSIFNW